MVCFEQTAGRSSTNNICITRLSFRKHTATDLSHLCRSQLKNHWMYQFFGTSEFRHSTSLHSNEKQFAKMLSWWGWPTWQTDKWHLSSTIDHTLHCGEHTTNSDYYNWGKHTSIKFLGDCLKVNIKIWAHFAQKQFQHGCCRCTVHSFRTFYQTKKHCNKVLQENWILHTW